MSNASTTWDCAHAYAIVVIIVLYFVNCHLQYQITALNILLNITYSINLFYKNI